MSDETNKQVEEFIAKPRQERYAQYPKLPRDLKLKVRRSIEARRGIAFRAEGGKIIFTKEALIEKMADLKNKKDVEYPKRIEVLNDKMVEYKEQLLEIYGKDAVSEAEARLDAGIEATK